MPMNVTGCEKQGVSPPFSHRERERRPGLLSSHEPRAARSLSTAGPGDATHPPSPKAPGRDTLSLLPIRVHDENVSVPK